MNVVVAIDDLHPEQGWGCEGDTQVEYLTALNHAIWRQIHPILPKLLSPQV